MVNQLISLPLVIRVTALVVKILSLVAQRQTFGQQGRAAKVVPEEEITHSVRYLLSVQKNDGSFSDQHPVLHRNVLVAIYKILRSTTVCILE